MGIAKNDTSFINKMLQLFISETGTAVEKIVEAYHAGDLKTVKYYAHRMKPSISNLGVNSIKEDVLELEFITARSEEMAGKVANIDRMLAAVITQMKADYNM
jgi:HPt (histidine-containing phosphotransfer) domain-containing protein